MISKELAKKIRYIQIFTSKTVNDVLAGEYQSAFKGSGMEFDEVREYQPGDEVRSIDWNVTARQGRPYVKRFHEERELTVMFLVDLSASGKFGSSTQTKNELAAELCALLSFSAVKSNDKVGLILFTDRIERFIPPAKGTTHALRIIREVMGFHPTGGQTDIEGALDYLGRVIRKRCVVFLISDFQGEGFERRARVVAKKHDLIAVSVADKREMDLPDVGLLELEDAETGETVLIDTGSAGIRGQYAAFGEEERRALRNRFRGMGVDLLELLTGENYAKKLVQFFRRREHA
ncbi:MAG: DUF58 domain-containing protein [Victivallales bacterium]|nr:DUF58 domain-containing protein [Victivallales bacterium]